MLVNPVRNSRATVMAGGRLLDTRATEVAATGGRGIDDNPDVYMAAPARSRLTSAVTSNVAAKPKISTRMNAETSVPEVAPSTLARERKLKDRSLPASPSRRMAAIASGNVAPIATQNGSSARATQAPDAR